MKLLIMDDEPLMRQGIIKKLEKLSLPVHSIAEAGNGLEGLRKLPEIKPDIVITDIRMPEMNGLDFIHNAKKFDEKLQFIIVSGYEEFEFAKRGIQYGVVDYLLKPVENEELESSLIRIMAKIEKDRRYSKLYDELWHLQKRTDETLREQLLTKFIQPGCESATLEKDEKLTSMQAFCREFVVVLFEIVLPPLPYRSFLKGDEDLLRFAISNAISQMMESSSREGMLFHHAIYDNELVHVLGDCQQIDLAVMKQELNEVMAGINLYLKLDVTIGFGLPVKQISRIHQSYQHAKMALREKIIHGRNKVYLSASAAGIRGNSSSIIAEEDERFLFRQLNDCNAASVAGWLNRRILAIVREEEASFNHLESFCVELHLLYRKYLLLQTKMPEWIIGEIDDMLSWLHNIENWMEIESKLSAISNTMIEHLNRLRHSSEPNIMDEVKRYIDANLHEPLSLQLIAERFFIHPNYFSRRFKERFKMSFVNYMTGERIRKAEQLLKETGLQIQEIAVIVGIPDAAYFSSVFRKATGTTPVQYRMQPNPK
ncbi:response regulator [Paenibacillus beijingensis]|uniref:AraC family transcriptional regulator n=1 Tax=Paenibacillus beijingensis TaxID=1126833 RepID=A0A0D5NKG1_9BACL|nr:response regulator [Paenibacillus beijingensis]AJY75605.1 hypothetical protein VN24_14870 [Paenibacillus beijingensis]